MINNIEVLYTDGQCTNQKEVHDMARFGLTNYRPLLADTTRECRRQLTDAIRQELHVIENLLGYGKYFGAMEVYDNGFNVWIRDAFTGVTSRLYIYRTDTPQPILREPEKPVLSARQKKEARRGKEKYHKYD